jgi:hypothetical protein
MTIILFVMALMSHCQHKQPKSDLFSAGKKLAELKGKKLNEVSGLAASVANPGMLWTHNDSGNDPEIFLIDLKTNIMQTYVLANVPNRDWEDIAIGPGPVPGKNYVYIGEIGDNAAIYPYKHIYRFEEPVFRNGEVKGKITISAFDIITFSLSDARRDTEALLVDPKTKDIYVISKWSKPVYVYQLKYPYNVQDTLVAQLTAALPFTKVVAADFSRDGSELLIKTYDEIFYWKNNDDLSVPTLMQLPARPLKYSSEPQGESVAWSTYGDGFYTLSEQKKGKNTYLYHYKRE